MRLIRTRAELSSQRAQLSSPVGLVPTMGALHAGHVALLDAARHECTAVVATVFVNPLQFGPTEDLARYPRTLDADVEICERAGVDVLWAPQVEDMYPAGWPQVAVDPGPLAEQLEGAVRPGHFTGVLTVVAKLLSLIRPDRAYFGQKDYQQLTLITRMAVDLDLGAQIVGEPTVRDADGLALSSRNAYLSPGQRRSATNLSRALGAGQAAADGGPAAVLNAARQVLAADPAVELDYLELRAADLSPAPEHGTARLLVAARVGTTRLIDNVAVQL